KLLCERRSLGGCIDRLDRAFVGLFVVLDGQIDELEVSDDHRQKVVEVMGNAAGELADCFHLLGLLKLRLSLFSRGDIDNLDNEMMDILVVIANDRYAGKSVDDAPIPGDIAKLL